MWLSLLSVALQAVSEGTKALSKQRLKQFKDSFVKIARSIKDDDMKESAILMESYAAHFTVETAASHI